MGLIEHVVVDLGRIEGLISDLEGALLVIAYVDSDLEWIKQRQQEIAEEYGDLIERMPVFYGSGKNYSRGLDFLSEAYSGFMGLGEHSTDLAEEARDIVDEYITVPDPDDPIWEELEEEVA